MPNQLAVAANSKAEDRASRFHGSCLAIIISFLATVVPDLGSQIFEPTLALFTGRMARKSVWFRSMASGWTDPGAPINWRGCLHVNGIIKDTPIRLEISVRAAHMITQGAIADQMNAFIGCHLRKGLISIG